MLAPRFLPALLAIAFVAFSLPPYLTLDPARSRVPVGGAVSGYYPLLVAHVVFGSVALLTACLQVWPWLRRAFPDVHRRTGRVYVFAGVLPAGVMGLVIGALTPFGPVLRASNVLLALVWLSVTMTGYRAGRQYRLADHRRWMTRSAVLTLSIITNRMWAVVWVITLCRSSRRRSAATSADGSEHRRAVRMARLGAAAARHGVVAGHPARTRSPARGRSTGSRRRAVEPDAKSD